MVCPLRDTLVQHIKSRNTSVDIKGLSNKLCKNNGTFLQPGSLTDASVYQAAMMFVWQPSVHVS